MDSALKKIGNLKVYVKKNTAEIRHLFARDISKKIQEFHHNGNRDVLFLSSGGSALSVLDEIDKEIIGQYLTIGIMDERYDPSLKTSNYAALMKTQFFKIAVSRKCRLIDTATRPHQTQDELTNYYERELRSWRDEHPKGVIIATIGVAVDGHTAGIIPFPENKTLFHELFESDNWITQYDATGKNPYPRRVTTTLTFLRLIDYVGVFLVGEEKGEMLKKLLSGDDLSEMPGRIIKELSQGAVYMDESLFQSLK